MSSNSPIQNERFDDVVREFIDFINAQVGVYMDALAGFEGHYARVERQIHMANRPTSLRKADDGEQVMVWTSYEDPSKPDIIHNRIIRAEDYLLINAPGGANEQQHARAIIVFLYTAWELEYRPRLAVAKSIDLNEIKSDVMGDLRIIRHSILHTKSTLSSEDHRKLKKLGVLFQPDQLFSISYENMHQIFILTKQECGRLLSEWLNLGDTSPLTSPIHDIAVQRVYPTDGNRRIP